MPFQKGQSGNPGGRPKERPFKDALRQVLSQEDDADKKKKLVLLAEALVAKAIDGDVPAAKEVMDRVEGRVPTPVAGADGEGPVEAIIQVVTGINRAPGDAG